MGGIPPPDPGAAAFPAITAQIYTLTIRTTRIFMITRKCKYCGKEYATHTTKKIYCSDKCRAAAYQERLRNGYKSQVKDIQARESAKNLKKSQTAFSERLNAGDPKAKWLYMKRTKPNSYEYWLAFQEYDLSLDDDLIHVVNGIRTDESDFADRVMFMIDEAEQIRIETIKRTEKPNEQKS